MVITALPPSVTSLPATKFTAFSSPPLAPGVQQSKGASKVTISSDAARLARFEQSMNEVRLGVTRLRADFLHEDNISSPATADLAHAMAYENLTDGKDAGGLVDISGLLPGGDGILRYSSGDQVTEESKSYFNEEAARFQKERVQLYESEVANGTPPGEIVRKLYDLMGQQPERFRMMNMWL